MKIKNYSHSESLLNYIGNTPLIKVKNLKNPDASTIWAKLENLNPSGSIKDRIAASILRDSEEKGLIQPNKTTIVEATSGNTGIALALVCSILKYKLILVMPKNVSFERKQIIKAYGAEIIEIESSSAVVASIKKAKELVNENSNFFLFGQFFNKESVNIHKITTGKEIIEQVPGKIDAFVCGIGTGGTISGIGEVLKEEYPNCIVVGVEPENCAVISGNEPGSHCIQGIGVGFIPEVLNTNIFNKIIQVSDEQAKLCTREIVRNQGIFVGISSGANFYASKIIANEFGKDSNIVTIFCDGGERYLSTDLYS